MNAKGFRWGVRLTEFEQMKKVARLGGAIFISVGFATWAAIAAGYETAASSRSATAFLLLNTVVGGLVMLGPEIFGAERFLAWYPWLAWVVHLGGVAMWVVGMQVIGFPFALIGYSILTGHLVIGLYQFNRVAAAILSACVAAAVALHLVVEPRHYHDLGQWMWVMTSLGMLGVLLGNFMDEIDQARASEGAAHAELEEVNNSLQATVAEQVEELGRLGQLRRFLAAPVANAVMYSDNDAILEAHRREIAVMFCDLRGFTAFSARVEPEEVIDVLDAYYAVAGQQLSAFGATVGSFAGDGIFAYLNDPYPIDDPAGTVVRLAHAVAADLDILEERWRQRGYELSYGIGLAMGHATLGAVGYAERSDYTAIGTVVNRGARLCAKAAPRQIIVDKRIHVLTGERTMLNALPALALKGFDEPQVVFELVR